MFLADITKEMVMQNGPSNLEYGFESDMFDDDIFDDDIFDDDFEDNEEKELSVELEVNGGCGRRMCRCCTGKNTYRATARYGSSRSDVVEEPAQALITQPRITTIDFGPKKDYPEIGPFDAIKREIAARASVPKEDPRKHPLYVRTIGVVKKCFRNGIFIATKRNTIQHLRLLAVSNTLTFDGELVASAVHAAIVQDIDDLLAGKTKVGTEVESTAKPSPKLRAVRSSDREAPRKSHLYKQVINDVLKCFRKDGKLIPSNWRKVIQLRSEAEKYIRTHRHSSVASVVYAAIVQDINLLLAGKPTPVHHTITRPTVAKDPRKDWRYTHMIGKVKECFRANGTLIKTRKGIVERLLADARISIIKSKGKSDVCKAIVQDIELLLGTTPVQVSPLEVEEHVVETTVEEIVVQGTQGNEEPLISDPMADVPVVRNQLVPVSTVKAPAVRASVAKKHVLVLKPGAFTGIVRWILRVLCQ